MEEPYLDPGVRHMLAYQAGDEEAFDRLVGAYSGQLFALLTRFLGPAAGREDLVQEVFLRVIRARASYRPTARFSTWLYRIAFNLCVNERERLARRSEVSLDAGTADRGADEPRFDGLFDPDAAAPSDGLERDDAVRAVREAVAALPDSQRMALILAKYEDMPFADIAGVMDSSEKAIKSMVHRARENLRARLAPFLQGELA